jgi:hypothetical protein
MADAARDSQPGQAIDAESQARRQFLKRVGTASATIPAVSLLLAASFKRASAQSIYGDASGGDATGGSGSS